MQNGLRVGCAPFLLGTDSLSSTSYGMRSRLSQALRRSRYHAVVIAMTGARGLEAAIQAKQLAPETPLVWWSDDKNFALIAYHLRIPVFLPADCSDQELYEAIKPIMKWRCEHANCAMQL
ncbi:MAG: hypothetical protein ACLR8X_03035 [Gallintestinimicrobium sp.]